MKHEVVLTAQAVGDLEDIGEWLLQHNPKYAILTVRSLRQRCESLADTPFRGTPIAGKRITRRAVFGPYLVVYDVEGRRVTVLRVLHGSRDVKRLLGDN